MEQLSGGWQQSATMAAKAFRCGFCGKDVASDRGYHCSGGNTPPSFLRICPLCNLPTLFTPDGKQRPGVAFGQSVGSVPPNIENLYDEARRCTSAGAYTAAVLACRKLLMHIGVAQGAAEGLSFVQYVEYLAAKGFVPPGGGGWVDHIRQKSNEANHEIVMMKQEDAAELITFLEMLLKFIYEFPARVPTKAP